MCLFCIYCLGAVFLLLPRLEQVPVRWGLTLPGASLTCWKYDGNPKDVGEKLGVAFRSRTLVNCDCCYASGKLLAGPLSEAPSNSGLRRWKMIGGTPSGAPATPESAGKFAGPCCACAAQDGAIDGSDAAPSSVRRCGAESPLLPGVPSLFLLQ